KPTAPLRNKSVCLQRHPAVAYLFLVRPMSTQSYLALTPTVRRLQPYRWARADVRVSRALKQERGSACEAWCEPLPLAQLSVHHTSARLVPAARAVGRVAGRSGSRVVGLLAEPRRRGAGAGPHLRFSRVLVEAGKGDTRR